MAEVLSSYLKASGRNIELCVRMQNITVLSSLRRYLK